MRLFACSLLLLAFAITLPETSVSAADTDVPLPTLPKGAGTLDGPHFARALVSAADHAYAAISQPIEGTMLTVMRDAG